VVLAAVLLSLPMVAVRGTWRRAGSGSRIRSIAVLPFENLSADAEQEYFVDGMTDAVITDLAQVRALRVISRTSVLRYKKTRKSAREIAKELGVDAVVEGTAIRSGDRVRVTAQLIATATDEHLWAREYEREARDVLTLQRELAAAIAEAVEVKLQPREQSRLAATAAVDPDAYEAYLKGRFYWATRSAEGKLKAERFFQDAIAKDPTYAPAYSGLSDTYRQFGIRGLRPREYMPKAEAAARQALALDDSLPEAHASLAGVLYRYEWDWDGAEREFRTSLDLDPGAAETHRAYGVFLMALRRDPEALVQMRRAWELSPLSPVINIELALALARNRRHAEAVQRLEKTLEIEASWRVYATLAMNEELQGHREEAVPLFEKASSFGVADAVPWLGYGYGVAGRRRDALTVVTQMEAAAGKGYVSPADFALVYVGLGDRDRAMAELEKAYEQRAFEILGFAREIYDGMHEDPRFQDLLRRMKIPIAGPAPSPKP
jgi:TolB-like protein/Tfp pilus assembly protein PilF